MSKVTHKFAPSVDILDTRVLMAGVGQIPPVNNPGDALVGVAHHVVMAGVGQIPPVSQMMASPGTPTPPVSD